LSAHKRKEKGKSHDDQEKVVLVTTMALFANISDSWWIGSSHHIFFRKEEFGADMIEELGSSYMDWIITSISRRGTEKESMKALIDQLIIGTHENIRTTYIGLQKSKHQLFFLQLDLLVFIL